MTPRSRDGDRSVTAAARATKSRSEALVSCSRLNGTLKWPARTRTARVIFTSAKTSRHGCSSPSSPSTWNETRSNSSPSTPTRLRAHRQPILEGERRRVGVGFVAQQVVGLEARVDLDAPVLAEQEGGAIVPGDAGTGLALRLRAAGGVILR